MCGHRLLAVVVVVVAVLVVVAMEDRCTFVCELPAAEPAA
jgi:hypothetical protein